MSHLDELLSVYLDGEITPPESERVESHLRECLRCRRTLADLNSARTAIRSLPTLEMPVGLVPETQGRPARRRTVWMGAAAAVAAAVIALAAAVASSPEPLNLNDVSRQLGARASLDSGAAPFKVVLPTGGWE